MPSSYALSCLQRRGYRWPDPPEPSKVTTLSVVCEKMLPGDPAFPDAKDREFANLHPTLRRLLPRLGSLEHLHVVASGGRPIDLRLMASALSRVQRITMEGNNCRRILLTSVGALKSLRRVALNCHGTDADFTVLGALPLLEDVEIGSLGNPGPKTFASLARHQRLWRLSIPDTKQGADALAVLGRIRSLRELSLRTLYVKAAALRALGQLPALERLELDSIWFDAEEYAVLGSLKHLRRLKLIRSHIDDAGLAHLGRLRGLSHLRVETRRNQLAISDRGLQALAGLTTLETLSLGASNVSSPGITDASCDTVSRLTRLETLRLPWTRITDRCLVALGRLGRLRTLELDSPTLTGRGLSALAGLRHLHHLILARARVTVDDLSQLSSWAVLRKLDLRGLGHLPCHQAALARIRRALPRVVIRCAEEAWSVPWGDGGP